MENLITNLVGQAVLSSAIVLAFVELLKRGIPPKYFTTRMYPWAALIIGILVNIFLGAEVGLSFRMSAAIGAISALMAVGVFKYGKYEESKGNTPPE